MNSEAPVDIHPMDRVASADQDTWLELAQAIRNRIFALAMSDKLTPEEVVMLIGAAKAAMALELRAASYDEILHRMEELVDYRCVVDI